jgi:hypothetical protein
MSNFKRMHIIAGTLAIIFLVWMFPKCWEVLNTNWQKGIGFTAGIAMGGYMLGCVVGLLLNLILHLFHK